jgi:hypothetical protein
MESMADPDLDDPRYAAFAWARYWRILRWMTLLAVGAAILCVLVLWIWLGALPIHMAIATLLGVGFTVWLTAALMGLMFLSSGSGHDARIENRLEDEQDPPA